MFDLLRELNDPALRAALDEITSQFTGDDVGRQIALIRDLGAQYSHSITPAAEAVPSDPSTFRYTCFQHAFELIDPPLAVVDIATLYPAVYPSAEFVEYLIAQHLTEVRVEDTHDADLVVYWADAGIRHAGKVRERLIFSKWGTAHMWSHGLFQVPASYGNTVRFFLPISRDESVEAFLAFAESKLGFKLA